jgi:hypothetical protein
MSKLFGIKKWSELSEDNKDDAENLGWDETSWDNDEKSRFLLGNSWDDVNDVDYRYSQKNLGFTKEIWDDLRGIDLSLELVGDAIDGDDNPIMSEYNSPVYDDNFELSVDVVDVGDDRDWGESPMFSEWQSSEKANFEASMVEGETYIIIIEYRGEDVMDILVKVIRKNEEDNSLVVLDVDNDNEYILKYDENNIILKTDEYDIFDVDKVDELDLKDMKLIDFSETVEEYLELELVDKEVREYDIMEKRSDLINDLIVVRNAFGNDFKQNKIISEVNIFMELLSSDDVELLDTLEFLNNYNNKLKLNLPNYLIPIASTYKVLYDDDVFESDVNDIDNIIIKNYKMELDDLNGMIESKSVKFGLESKLNMSYLEYVNIIMNDENDSQIINKNNERLLLEHVGEYLRFNNLSGDKLEEFKTRCELMIPNMSNEFMKILNKKILNVMGFIFLPMSFMWKNLDLKNASLSLIEKILLKSVTYTYKSFNKILSGSDIVSVSPINKSTIKLDENLNNLLYYNFSDKVDEKDIFSILSKNLPNNKDIYESLGEMKDRIYNYNDFSKLLMMYNINYNNIIFELRIEVDDQINANVERYILKYNKVGKKKEILKLDEKVISVEDKIRVCKDKIFSLKDERLKNYYIDKLINLYSHDVDDDSIYTSTGDVLLCKHYLYSCKMCNNNDMFDILKTKYGDVKDGKIICKVCNEYICDDDFSSVGFYGVEEDVEEDELSEKEYDIKEIINNLERLLNIRLMDKDMKLILGIIMEIDDRIIITERYNIEISDHPIYKEIIKRSKIKKGIIDSEKKAILTRRSLETNQFLSFVKNSNIILSILVLIIISVQISIPSYIIKARIDMKILNVKENWLNNLIMNGSIEDIEISTINNLERLLKSVKAKDDMITSTILKVNDEGKMKGVLPFKNQIINLLKYYVNNSLITNNINKYEKYINKNNEYKKEYFPSYKPYYNNKLIVDINRKVSEGDELNKVYFIKDSDNIALSNISLLVEKSDMNKSVELDIKLLDILNNNSFKRFFDYIYHLYGNVDNIEYLDLLINKLLDDMGDEFMEFFKDVWDNSKNSLKGVNYMKLKLILINILESYEKVNKNAIDMFWNRNTNNFNLYLLNGNPKRYYSYNPSMVLINYSFDEFMELESYKPKDGDDISVSLSKMDKVSGVMINKLFDNYYEDDGILMTKGYHMNYLNYLLLEYGESVGEKDYDKLDLSDELYMRIVKNLFNKLSYDGIYIDDKDIYLKEDIEEMSLRDIIVEDRIINFFNDNNYLNMEGDYSETLLRILDIMGDIRVKRELSKEDMDKYDDVFSELMGITYMNDVNYLDNILEFLKTNFKYVDKAKEKQLEKLFKLKFSLSAKSERMMKADEKEIKMRMNRLKMLDSLKDKLHSSLLMILEDDDYNFKIKFIKQVKRTLGKIINNKDKNSLKLPKNWKLSEYAKDSFMDYLRDNDFVLHMDMYNKKLTDDGFNKYMKDDVKLNINILYDNIFGDDYIKGIENLVNTDRKNLNNVYINNILNFVLIFTLYRITEYIMNFFDVDSVEETNVIELYKLLDLEESYKKEDNIITCMSLLLDLIINMLSEYNDERWIIQNRDVEKLNKMLSMSRELEKQDILKRLDAQTTSDREISVELKKIGDVTFYHESVEYSKNKVKGENYSKSIEDSIMSNLLSAYKDDHVEIDEGDEGEEESDSYDRGDLDIDAVEEEEEMYNYSED